MALNANANARSVQVRVLSVRFRSSSGSNVERIDSQQFFISIVDRARNVFYAFV